MPSRLKVLTVDDNEYDRELIGRALAKSGLDIDLVEANTSEQARALLDSEQFDCILLDYLLPPTNGLELLKDLPPVSNVPAVVMLTGMGDERVAVEAIKSGVHEYIRKDDISAQAISESILHALELKRVNSEQLQRQSQLEQMSFYDHLTGLANRNLLMNRFDDYVKLAKRQHKKFCTLLIDLDGFKDINDLMGHMAGDQLLCHVGKRLLEASRSSDTVARIGGDEFVILLADTQDYVSASVVARKLITRVNQPVVIDGQQVQVQASLGIAMYPEHGNDPHVLIRNADKAMYKAKKQRLGFTVYTVDEADHRLSRISSDLPELLIDENLILHYQPKVHLGTGHVSGAEVLVRWLHPELGLLPPQEFIPMAEKSTLIRDLSYKLMNSAMTQYENWLSRDRFVPLSINLSSCMLSDHDLAANIENLRRSHNVDPGHITLEITESALITDPRRARKILEQLVSDGFRISIDDFGMGYASLSYLRDFPIHEIKIDKSFVQSVQNDVRNSYIIEAIVGLTKAFGAVSVAEGIENIGLWKQMQAMGCNNGQGYYISRPVSAKELELWKANWELSELHTHTHTLAM